MAKKKRATARKPVVKSKSKSMKSVNKKAVKNKPIPSRSKLLRVVRYALLFGLLSLLSYIISVIVTPGSASAILFDILWMIFFLCAFAFLLALFALMLLKWMRR